MGDHLAHPLCDLRIILLREDLRTIVGLDHVVRGLDEETTVVELP